MERATRTRSARAWSMHEVNAAWPVHAGVDRQERRPRHAVLEARPGRAPERVRTGQQPLVERAHPSAMGEDLRPREIESWSRHVKSAVEALDTTLPLNPTSGLLGRRRVEEPNARFRHVAGIAGYKDEVMDEGRRAGAFSTFRTRLPRRTAFSPANEARVRGFDRSPFRTSDRTCVSTSHVTGSRVGSRAR